MVALRNREGELRAFYNVCKHRGHELLFGEGHTKRITCPYHAWTYDLDGALVNAPRCEHLENFDRREICLDPVRIEVFCHLVFVNLDTGSFKCFGCGQSGRAITLNWGGIASVCASSGMESAPEGQARTCFLMASASACVKSIQGFLLGSKTFPSPFTHLPL